MHRRMVPHMTARHAAALALAGWYLMSPPISYPATKGLSDKDAPLSTWYLQRSFDSAEECERARRKADDEASRKIHGLAESHSIIERQQAQILALDKLDRCVETDDPRLEEKAQ